MPTTAEERKIVKNRGFLSNKGGEAFSARIITGNGTLDAKQMRSVCEIAEKFGSGQLAFTTRLTVELPGIAYKDIEAVEALAAESGLAIGGTGARVRPVVACKGTVCVFGLIDTQGLAAEIHTRFFEGYAAVALPHKFKIAVGGCPNSCVKPNLNDLGIVGCKQSGEAFYRVYIGGTWGKQHHEGAPLEKIFTRDEVLNVVEKALLIFKERGLHGERFSATVARLGFSEVESILTGSEILELKEAIISQEINKPAAK